MYMKRRYMLLILLVVFGLLFWAIVRDSAQRIPPLENKQPVIEVPAQQPAQKDDTIIVASPLPEATVTNPIIIKGRARGNWFFEATAPVEVVNWDGLIVGQGYIKVDDGHDWMTTEYVPFTGTISYDKTQLGAYQHGWIILKKANASGEPQFDSALEFKVFFN